MGNFSAFDDDGDSQTRTTNEANEITAITGGSVTPSYDAAGNMKYGPKPGNETPGLHYVYDAWNRLVAVYEDDGDGTFEPDTDDDSVAEYTYDGTNRRVEKVVTGTSDVHYYYNRGWQLLEERFLDGQGATVSANQYVWSPDYIDSPILRFHDANGDGDVLDQGDNTRYYTSDANYNVTSTIDAATGAVVEYYTYTAYGAATVYDNTWSNPTTPTTDGPLYCGYFHDAETGLYHVRNRYYHSSLSTFISRDPIGYRGSEWNTYEYAADNPLTYRDPDGRKASTDEIDVLHTRCDVTTGLQYVEPGSLFPQASHPCYLSAVIVHEAVHIADDWYPCAKVKEAYDKMIENGWTLDNAKGMAELMWAMWTLESRAYEECRAYTAGFLAATSLAQSACGVEMLCPGATGSCCYWALRAVAGNAQGMTRFCPVAPEKPKPIEKIIEDLMGGGPRPGKK